MRAAGTRPTAEQFGRTHPKVPARFLRRRDAAEMEPLNVLAAPTAFDRPLFQAPIERFRIGYPPTRFTELCDLSIIEPGADGRRRLHALMREHLPASLDPDPGGALHAFLFDWFDARTPRERARDRPRA